MIDKNRWAEENPWLGLGAYNEGAKLYGRDKETSELAHIIANHLTVVVYGKSGIGKSSLLRAGVFPQLRRELFVPIYLRLVHNTDTPYSEQIKNAIKENVVLTDLLPQSIPDLGLWDFMHRYQFTDSEGHSVTPVLVLDQFEEIFTLTDNDHKAEVQNLFNELSDILNETKPDQVIKAEATYTQNTVRTTTSTSGFTLQSLSKPTFSYEKSSSFRMVFSLRDDSLYLLERASAKIPSLKVNRYNLCALDEQNALEVITMPRPGLFTKEEAQHILDGLAYYEYDDYRVVDPAILSLFLFSYYKEQGRISYENIFEKYYAESIQSISQSTVKYIEDELLTDNGYRKRLSYQQLLDEGILPSEIEHLKKNIILKQEKEYIEFSHDLLCKEALKHKAQRIADKNKKAIKILISTFLAIIASIFTGMWIVWPKNTIEMVSLKLQISEDSAFAPNEYWSADFMFLTLSQDSVLTLPVQNESGMVLESMKAYKRDGANEFLVSLPKDFITKEKYLRLKLYNLSDNCSQLTDTINLQQWEKVKLWTSQVKHVAKTQFVGKIVTEEGAPLQNAMVILGNEPMKLSGTDGQFTFFLDKPEDLNSDLYVFMQGYETEHILGDLLSICRKGTTGTNNNPLTIPLKSDIDKIVNVDFKKLFAEQLQACVSLYELARDGIRNNQELHPNDSARLDSVIKVFPHYALNLKRLRRTNKMTADRTLDVYCVSIYNDKVKGIRDAIGNYLKDGENHLFKGKLIETKQDGASVWRLSAIAWDKENNQFVIQGIFENMSIADNKSFTCEILKPYVP